MVLFKKKSEIVPFNYVLKSNDLKLILDQNNYSTNKNSVRCLIISSDDILELVGGTEPYKARIYHLSIGYPMNYDFVFDKKKVNNNDSFVGNNLQTIGFDLSKEDLVKFMLSKENKGKFSINLSDNNFKNIEVEFDFDCKIFLEQVKKYFYEYIEFKELILRHYESYKDKLYAELLFIPEFKIFSFDKEFNIEINFDKNSGLKDSNFSSSDISKRYDSSSNLEYFSAVSLRILVEDKDKLIHNKNSIIEGVITVKTSSNKIKKEFKVNNSELKKDIIERFYGDYKKYDEGNLIAVHAMLKKDSSKLIDSKVFGSKVLYASPFRPTIHLTLNHVVSAHENGTWENCDMVIFMPFKDLVNYNSNTIWGGSTVDFFFIGFIRLPLSTVIIYRNYGESWNDFKNRIDNTVSRLGFKVMPGGQWNWSVNSDDSLLTWWNNFCESRGWSVTQHTFSEFGKIERIAELNTTGEVKDNSKELRKNWIIESKIVYLEFYNKYKKVLEAWDSYWNKKGV